MKRPKLPTLLPKRGATHRVDTSAFRMLLGHLHVDWIVRSMEERDYGIDLQLEIFDDAFPTGTMVFGQLKGTNGSFGDEDGFQFPVKTLLYAELFTAPFFLFRTSLADKVTRFIWLQKYVETKLSNGSQKWRSQDKVKIGMPEENDLVANSEHFLLLANDSKRQQQAVKFLRIEANLALHAPNVISGEHKVAGFCSIEAQKIGQVKEFILSYVFMEREIFDELLGIYRVFDVILAKDKATAKQRKNVIDCLRVMADIKMAYLSEPEIQEFVTSQGAVTYH